MKSSLSLWRATGSIDRGRYTLIGIGGFAIKHNLISTRHTFTDFLPLKADNFC